MHLEAILQMEVHSTFGMTNNAVGGITTGNTFGGGGSGYGSTNRLFGTTNNEFGGGAVFGGGPGWNAFGGGGLFGCQNNFQVKIGKVSSIFKWVYTC